MNFFMLANLSLILLISLISLHQISSWPFTILLFSFSSLLPFFLNHWLLPGGFAWRNHHVDSPNLHGPTGWPILGSLPEMGSLAHRRLAQLATSLGASRLMAFSLGFTRVIISSHPDTAKEILSGSAFSDRPIKESARALMFERAIGFAPAEKYWRHLRRIAANHMFSPRNISSLEELRQRVADEILASVWNAVEEKGEVELRKILQHGSLRNIIESVFGSDLCSEQEEMLGLMVKEGYGLVSEFNWEDYFPVRFLDFYGVKRRCHELAGKVKAVVGRIVEEKKRVGTGEGGGNDFLSSLISLPEEDKLSDSDMVAVLWEMIFRGTDTVAILLEWTLARIVLHQDIQTKIQEEIDAAVGSHCGVRDSDLPNLPYLQAVVKEVLRMHPPGPLLSWARLAIHDVHVGKVFVPAGTTAMVNMWAITHDQSIWKDPWAFKPERFIEEEVSIMGSDLRLAPFGSGRRVCPGKALGLATVHLWLARLLHQFKWLPGAPVDFSETLRLSLEMKKPLACRVVRRDNGIVTCSKI